MRQVSQVALMTAREPEFAWLLGGEAVGGLSLPPGGVEDGAIVEMLRGVARRVHAVHQAGAWLIVAGDEVVGLCGFKAPTDGEGAIEIGYGIAESRRRRGFATAALAAMLIEIARDSKVRMVTAETAVASVGSQRVLEANGFVRTGTRLDPEDGEVIGWRLA